MFKSFLFCRTPLIKLSPKKTWEGYLGGGVATVFMSMGLAHFMCKSTWLVCPIGEQKCHTQIRTEKWDRSS